MPSSSPSNKVVVIGGGVIGCTSALILAQRGYSVTLVARDLPGDLSQDACSLFAGANWHPFQDSSLQVQSWERIGFLKLKSLIPSGLVRSLPWVAYSKTEDDNSYIDTAWYNDLIPDHKTIPKNELPSGYLTGSSLTTLSLAPHTYLPWLLAQLQNLGVKVVRQKVESIEEAAYLVAGRVDCVVNATGLGAASLGGVMDEECFPIRGQTVLVRAPWLTYGQWVSGYEDGTFIYIIPRPDGNVILGGTMDNGSWDTSIHHETTLRILQNAYEAMPELSNGSGWEAIDVISSNVGLRPARRGGPRMELEEIKVEKGGERTVGVVHAYGIGPAGYQASWGMAENVGDLVYKHFRSTINKSKL
ncbi:FAD dependent oxidoreductase [Mrakia frigida]|uniref:FAD-dependent oxidoreductase n=1 Tax=Mrakia frigida TaxID=29902 RepID=UPI003FCC0919